MTIESKAALRRRMRAERLAHAEALPNQVRALVFHRPPRPVLEMVPGDGAIGLYHAVVGEAFASGYTKFFIEQGRTVALPWFADKAAPMRFRVHSDPFGCTDLEQGPFGPQPATEAEEVVPFVVFAPLVAFAPDGRRLGQGGGHYDRWLSANPHALAIGLAWDMQEVANLPNEPHDRPLAAIVTPTRVIGPFA
ncbi:5-formyltetrahydrofolate cyclo-ligase family protein [Tsuneonella dongtanensis]|uniref:5-formyltetrahydrofolate cyclo-ligase n=1 Tax=Tsuneonella dongtanensis TaxID=692370 RepID=A0A1B2AEG4_9SPHN|nr:5-formyltetrahydrofolate cyclo-ligase family protein [Tsuneonella dongtanensis]